MRVAENVLELIGQTPILRLGRMTGPDEGEVYVKLEGFNPGGSIKDRPGLFMIEKAEKDGLVRKGSVILEATSGNTGIGLAMAGSVKGYQVVIVMPENMSEERKKIMRAYGASLVLTPAEEGMAGAVEKARQLAEDDEKYFWVQQFDNHANAESHARSTALEILEQMDGKLDAIVAGIGSGGTITGIAEGLKKEIPSIQMIGIEPANSAVISGKMPGSHKIQGIGAGFIPSLLNLDLVDEIMAIDDIDAINTCRIVARKEALLLGISSGAAIFVALQKAKMAGPGYRVLAIAPDGAEKYMSTELFDE
ncbi:MAG: cysteine synthase A [Bacillota bacterium]|nr:cysteine synthase A [Bacillota bacterium]